MMGFIDNRSEVTTWMRYSFKIKSTKSKATFLKLKINIFLNLKQQAADH